MSNSCNINSTLHIPIPRHENTGNAGFTFSLRAPPKSPKINLLNASHLPSAFKPPSAFNHHAKTLLTLSDSPPALKCPVEALLGIKNLPTVKCTAQALLNFRNFSSPSSFSETSSPSGYGKIKTKKKRRETTIYEKKQVKTSPKKLQDKTIQLTSDIFDRFYPTGTKVKFRSKIYTIAGKPDQGKIDVVGKDEIISSMDLSKLKPIIKPGQLVLFFDKEDTDKRHALAKVISVRNGIIRARWVDFGKALVRTQTSNVLARVIPVTADKLKGLVEIPVTMSDGSEGGVAYKLIK